MRKSNLLICVILIAMHIAITEKCTAQTTIGGVLNGEVVLGIANSPYIVTNNLLVQQDAIVTIEPGVELRFDHSIYLEVDGTLRAIGTATDSIYFTTNNNAEWAGIRFNYTSEPFNEETSEGCILSHCVIEKNGYFLNNLDGKIIHLNYGSPKISDCDIRNAYVGIYGVGSPRIVNCKIHQCQWQPLNIVNPPNSEWAVIQNNEIFDCSGADGISLGKVFFLGNYVHDLSTQIALRAMDTCVVSQNTIENCMGVAIGLQGTDGDQITCNTVSGCAINLLITCERHPLVENNNFIDYTDYHVYWDDYYYPYGNAECNLPPGSGTYATIDFTNNYWGGLNEGEMNEAIWDFNDDFSLQALIQFQPMLSSPANTGSSGCAGIPDAIDEELQDPGVRLYPNPGSSEINLYSPNYFIKQVAIFDAIGKEVNLTMNTDGDSTILIDCSSFESGVYFARTTLDNDISTSNQFIKL